MEKKTEQQPQQEHPQHYNTDDIHYGHHYDNTDDANQQWSEPGSEQTLKGDDECYQNVDDCAADPYQQQDGHYNGDDEDFYQVEQQLYENYDDIYNQPEEEQIYDVPEEDIIYDQPPHDDNEENLYEAAVNDYEAPIDAYELPVDEYELPVDEYEHPTNDYDLPVELYENPVDFYENAYDDENVYEDPDALLDLPEEKEKINGSGENYDDGEWSNNGSFQNETNRLFQNETDAQQHLYDNDDAERFYGDPYDLHCYGDAHYHRGYGGLQGGDEDYYGEYGEYRDEYNSGAHDGKNYDVYNETPDFQIEKSDSIELMKDKSSKNKKKDKKKKKDGKGSCTNLVDNLQKNENVFGVSLKKTAQHQKNDGESMLTHRPSHLDRNPLFKKHIHRQFRTAIGAVKNQNAGNKIQQQKLQDQFFDVVDQNVKKHKKEKRKRHLPKPPAVQDREKNLEVFSKRIVDGHVVCFRSIQTGTDYILLVDKCIETSENLNTVYSVVDKLNCSNQTLEDTEESMENLQNQDVPVITSDGHVVSRLLFADEGDAMLDMLGDEIQVGRTLAVSVPEYF